MLYFIHETHVGESPNATQSELAFLSCLNDLI